MSTSYLTPADLAERWSKKQSSLAEWRCHGKGPAFIKIGGHVRYRLQDIEAFEAERLRSFEEAQQ